jgi:hypothetical protein
MTYFDNLYNRYMQEANSYAAIFGLDPATSHNGAWDAFRHAYASGAMTRENSEEIARLFGDLNEIKGDLLNNQPGYEKNMDLWNNAIGRQVGRNSNSNNEVAQGVYAALKRGDLITDPLHDDREFYDPSGQSGDPATGLPWPGDDWDDDMGDAQQTTSPLVLDINGDGVQTTRLSKSFTQGVHFNLDAKGLAENTGWVDASDGLLVRDLNADSKINSGRELFGNHTLLKSGHQAKAMLLGVGLSWSF